MEKMQVEETDDFLELSSVRCSRAADDREVVGDHLFFDMFRYC